MQKTYLIAVDLDGTLIKNFDDYDQISFDYLKKLSENNIIVIATGRPYRSSQVYYNLLNLNTPLINYNGALIHHPLNPNFPKRMITIDRQVVIDLISFHEDYLINVFCEIEDEIFLWKNSDEIIPFLHLDGGVLSTGAMTDILHGNPNGAIVFSKEGSEQRLAEYLKEKYQDQIKIRFWQSSGIVISEIYNSKTSKGQALKLLADYYSIPQERVIAIGDGPNDVEMFNYAGISVAMENSHPDLLKEAKYHTASLDNHGVYQFLKNYFKI